jgi:hypothetical protein
MENCGVIDQKQNDSCDRPESISISPTMSVCEYKNYYEDNEDEILEAKLCQHLGNNLPIVANLDDLIRELRQVFSCESVNVELVSYLMKSYKSHPVDWKKYAKFDRHR